MLNFCKKSGGLETTQRNIPWKEELFNGLRLQILELEWYAAEFSILSSRKKMGFFFPPLRILLVILKYTVHTYFFLKPLDFERGTHLSIANLLC